MSQRSTMLRQIFIVQVVFALILASPIVSLAGVAYEVPAGGWRYTYDGTFQAGIADSGCIGGTCPPGYGTSNDLHALDGTWQHQQGDKWDGSGPGEIGLIPDGDAPGGAEALLDGSTSYLRIQDAGNPEHPGHGWVQGPTDPVNNNRRVYFGHKMEDDGALTSELVLDNGITFSMRARVPISGPLDNIYGIDVADNAFIRRWYHAHPADYNQNSIVDAADFTVWRDTLGSTYDLRADADDGSGTGTPDGVVDQFDYDFWQANFGATQAIVGRGHPIHNDGRGMLNIVQNDAAFFNLDSSIGFSLMTSQDVAFLCESTPGAPICALPNQSGGLIMNNLVGPNPSASVDTTDSGTLNLLNIDDANLHEWREFWITVEEDGSIGTHTVNVYIDGATIATTFHVSSNLNGDSTVVDDAWLTLGLNDSDYFGSFDIDFFSYSLGVITPVPANSAVPEPGSDHLLLIGILAATRAIAWRRKRSGYSLQRSIRIAPSRCL